MWEFFLYGAGQFYYFNGNASLFCRQKRSFVNASLSLNHFTITLFALQKYYICIFVSLGNGLANENQIEIAQDPTAWGSPPLAFWGVLTVSFLCRHV